MAYTATRVASLTSTTTTTKASTVASTAIPGIGSTLGTRTCNVPDFTTAVAFLAGTAAREAATVAAAHALATVTRDVTFLTALVARLGLGFHGAIA